MGLKLTVSTGDKFKVGTSVFEVKSLSDKKVQIEIEAHPQEKITSEYRPDSPCYKSHLHQNRKLHED